LAVFAGRQANIYITGTATTSITSETLTANTDRTVFSINDAAKRFWDPTMAPTVKLGTTTLDPSTYRVAYAGGKIIFKEPVGAGTVTISSNGYKAVSALGEAKEWSVDIESDMEDVTPFGKDWKEFAPTLKGASGSLSRWWVDEFFFNKIDSLLGLSLEATTGKTYDCYARLTTNGIQVAVDGLVEESLDFQVIGDLTAFGM
jgi:hypothetical protein